MQTAVVNFVEWIQDPEGNVKFTVQAFQVVPQDLARRITLLQTVEMVRVAMEFFEKWLPLLARNDAQLRALTESVLRYGREIGFAAAAIYASAAESRGAWDSRLEALVVDAVVRGDTGPELLSRAAALNWDSDAPATVISTRVAHGARSRRQAAVEVGILNRSNPWIWWQVIGRDIVQTATVETMPFAPNHLMTTMDVFLDAMTTRDDLALRVGGEVA